MASVLILAYSGEERPGGVERIPLPSPPAQVSIQIFNDTDTSEFVHWHGQFIPSEVDGAGEEKSIVVPARGQVSYRFTPRPAGIRWVHTM